jgi:molecular chaperone GrpE
MSQKTDDQNNSQAGSATESHAEQPAANPGDTPDSRPDQENPQPGGSRPETGMPEPQTAGDDDAAAAEPQTVQIEADELVQLRADVQRFRDLALRTQADLENYRKRMAREKEEAVRYANMSLLEDLLPVVDNFEFGLQAAKGSSEESSIYQGMEMVYKQIQDFLSRNNVEMIDAAGQEFDPSVHEAMGQEPSDTVEQGHVVRQIRKGYKIGNRLLRPANVMVSSGPEKNPQ